MVEYPQELIERAQAYFSEKAGRVVSVEQAIDYLNALADLYESFIEFAVDSEASPVRALARRGDLLTASLNKTK